METFKVRKIKRKNGRRIGKFTDVKARTKKEAVVKFLKKEEKKETSITMEKILG